MRARPFAAALMYSSVLTAKHHALTSFGDPVAGSECGGGSGGTWHQGWYIPPGTKRSGSVSPSSPPPSQSHARRTTSAEAMVSMITGTEIDDVFNTCECILSCCPVVYTTCSYRAWSFRHRA